MFFSFQFSYGSCPRPRSRTKRSVITQTKIICCFWLLQTTYMEGMKAGSTGPPVQMTPFSPKCKSITRDVKTSEKIESLALAVDFVSYGPGLHLL